MPSGKALRGLRRRVGLAPVRRLFEILAGPLGQPCTPGIRFGGYRTVAFDGCRSVKVPDTPRNRGWLGKKKASIGVTGYPGIELMTLVETGTRALLGAVFGTRADGETTWARKLLHLLDDTMLVLMDRGFDGGEFLAGVAATKAQFLVRLTSTRRLPVLGRLRDGSVLSVIGGVKVRIITAAVTVTCHDGTVYGGVYRLATTLLGHRAYPADTLMTLYHERWQHEIAYLALRHTLLGGRVLRSGDPAGIEQEMWALLAVYQALRTAVTDAVQSVPGTDPDRASYQIAVETAQKLVTGRGERHRSRRGPGRRHRPRRPGEPARAAPASRLRPQGQVPAQPLEQAPRRQTPRKPADNQDHAHGDPRSHQPATRRGKSLTKADGP